MYNQNKITETSIDLNQSTEGEPLENKIERMMNNEAGIEQEVEMQYTDRKDGVRPEYNPRTDKWDLAAETMELASTNTLEARKEKLKELSEKQDGKPESTQGTEDTSKTSSEGTN